MPEPFMDLSAVSSASASGPVTVAVPSSEATDVP